MGPTAPAPHTVSAGLTLGAGRSARRVEYGTPTSRNTKAWASREAARGGAPIYRRSPIDLGPSADIRAVARVGERVGAILEGQDHEPDVGEVGQVVGRIIHRRTAVVTVEVDPHGLGQG